jgi:hypothetical protein
MNSAEREELDWLAFRYVAGELAADEAGDFEGRLARDQTARDAVSRAVELTSAICAVEATSSAPVHLARRRRVQQSLRWAVCLSACALVLIVCFRYLRHSESGPPGSKDVSSAAAAELAVVWSETRSEVADQVDDSWVWLEVADAGYLPTAVEDSAALVTPDWMLSAVVAVEADIPVGQPEEREDG